MMQESSKSRTLWSRSFAAAAGFAAAVLAAVVLLAPGIEPAHHTAVTAGSADVRLVVDAVPDRAWVTLQLIDAGKWPAAADAPGTEGGAIWQDREGRLPAVDSAGNPIQYQEWDVNPKRPGRSRDAERIITGSDGSAWYTGDHYRTFTQMR
jgi:guanyl-specific ribonuclease Sa